MYKICIGDQQGNRGFLESYASFCKTCKHLKIQTRSLRVLESINKLCLALEKITTDDIRPLLERS